MPTAKIGDRCTLKRLPLYNQIPEWSDDRKTSIFLADQVFEVIEVEKSKVTLQAVDHEESRFFEWFKNAIAKVLTVTTSEATVSESRKVVDSPSISCVIRPDGTRTAIIAEPQSAETDREPISQPEPEGKSLEFPEVKAEFTTAVTFYKGCRYWVAGKHPVGKKPGEYYYYIDRDGKVTQSELSYCSTVFANRWAREAIDKLAVLQEASC